MAYPQNPVLTNNSEMFTNSFRVAIGASGAVGTITQNDGAMVTSVTRTAGADSGIYTVLLAKPWPVNILACHVSLGTVATTSNLGRAAYKANSYDPTAGTFVINHSAPTDDTHATTQIPKDPVSGSEFHVTYTGTHTYASLD